MTNADFDKLIQRPDGKYCYGRILPTGQMITVGLQLALRRELTGYEPKTPCPAPSPAV